MLEASSTECFPGFEVGDRGCTSHEPWCRQGAATFYTSHCRGSDLCDCLWHLCIETRTCKWPRMDVRIAVLKPEFIARREWCNTGQFCTLPGQGSPRHTHFFLSMSGMSLFSAFSTITCASENVLLARREPRACSVSLNPQAPIRHLPGCGQGTSP